MVGLALMSLLGLSTGFEGEAVCEFMSLEVSR